MTETQDQQTPLEIVMGAAQKWVDEALEHIIPQLTKHGDEEDAEAYNTDAERVSAALDALRQNTAVTKLLAPPAPAPDSKLLPNRLYYCAPSEDYFYTPDGVELIWFENKAQALREVGQFGKPIITTHESPVQ